MRWVQAWIFGSATAQGSFGAMIQDILNGTVTATSTTPNPEATVSAMFEKVSATNALWDANSANVRTKLNPGRLRDQMFAYTVTNQIIGTFLEVGLPFILRWVGDFRKGKGKQPKGIVQGSPSESSSGSDVGSVNGTPKKRVVFEDEKERGGMEERAYLDAVRQEAALPEYDLFVDYSEMVVQFGYVALWSTIWPLAGGKP